MPASAWDLHGLKIAAAVQVKVADDLLCLQRVAPTSLPLHSPAKSLRSGASSVQLRASSLAASRADINNTRGFRRGSEGMLPACPKGTAAQPLLYLECSITAWVERIMDGTNATMVLNGFIGSCSTVAAAPMAISHALSLLAICRHRCLLRSSPSNCNI